MRGRAGLLCAASLTLGACTAVPPGIPAPTLRQDVPLAAALSPANAPASAAAWPRQDWWRHYDDPVLDTLIERAQADSPSLAVARARFSAASAAVRTTAAASGAQVQASGDASRQRLSDTGLFPPQFLGFHWYDMADLGLSASYTFDWWGKQRSAIDAAVDEARASQADRAAAALALASSVAQTYFGWQSDEARAALARDEVGNLQRQRDIARERLHAQIDRVDELHQLDAAAAQAREQQIALANSARLRVVVLAALLNCRPDQLPPLTARPLPQAGAQLPPDVSLDLIARRADIVASRWRVEAAAHGVAVARAGFLPDISVNALLGLSSIDFGKLLRIGSADPDFGAAVHLPLFDAGALRGNYAASRAKLDSAIANYDATVVTAAREVGSAALTRADYRSRRVERLTSVQAAAEQHAVAAARVHQGITDIRPELMAQQTWLAARDSLLQIDAAALDADVALIQALGGGYERPTDSAGAAPAPKNPSTIQ